MKKLFVGTLSALAVAGVTLTGFPPKAEAVLQMNFTAPFISNSGLANSAGSEHYFTVFVTSLPLEGLIVNIPNNMRILSGATVEDGDGNEIAANVTTGEGTIEIAFNEPVEPEAYLTIKLNGVEIPTTPSNGGLATYRVFGMWSGLDGTIPIGTAQVKLKDKSGN